VEKTSHAAIYNANAENNTIVKPFKKPVPPAQEKIIQKSEIILIDSCKIRFLDISFN